MLQLKYITTNKEKVQVANKYLVPLGISLHGLSVELEEIQSESITEITEYKAKQAYSIVREPLLVNDASWDFPALNGFPGAYMKYMNKWLTADDFIALMSRHEDKTVIYREMFFYIDGYTTKSFLQESIGTFLTKPSGTGLPTWTLVSLRKDKKSIAQCWEEGLDPIDDYPFWKEFADWYIINLGHTNN